MLYPMHGTVHARRGYLCALYLSEYLISNLIRWLLDFDLTNPTIHTYMA